MSLAVDRILERRARLSGQRPATSSVVAAVLLHGVALALFLLLPHLTPPPPPPSFVPVTILPAQALGVRRPASRPKPPVEKPAPEPEKPAPEPEPEPEPVREEAPVLPEETKKPEKPKPEPPTPRETAPRPAEPTRKPIQPPKPAASETPPSRNPSGTAAQGTPEGEAGRRGDAAGNPLGTTAFGSAIAGLDNPDFKFGYYIDQLLGAIDSKWARPNMGGDVRAIVSFRIQRNGGLTDLEVAESSGYNSFDLAALRAVQNASPFPPLPRGYKHDSLGVRLIVR